MTERIDVLLPIHGQSRLVTNALRTLKNWGLKDVPFRVIIHDSIISVADGTRDHVPGILDSLRIDHLLIHADDAPLPGVAYDRCLPYAESKFVATMHTDVEFYRDYLCQTLDRARANAYVFVARIRPLELEWKGRGLRSIQLPRPTCIAAVYDREYLTKHNLGWEENEFEARISKRATPPVGDIPTTESGNDAVAHLRLALGTSAFIRGGPGWRIYAHATRTKQRFAEPSINNPWITQYRHIGYSGSMYRITRGHEVRDKIKAGQYAIVRERSYL